MLDVWMVNVWTRVSTHRYPYVLVFPPGVGSMTKQAHIETTPPDQVNSAQHSLFWVGFTMVHPCEPKTWSNSGTLSWTLHIGFGLVDWFIIWLIHWAKTLPTMKVYGRYISGCASPICLRYHFEIATASNQICRFKVCWSCLSVFIF